MIATVSNPLNHPRPFLHWPDTIDCYISFNHEMTFKVTSEFVLTIYLDVKFSVFPFLVKIMGPY